MRSGPVVDSERPGRWHDGRSRHEDEKFWLSPAAVVTCPAGPAIRTRRHPDARPDRGGRPPMREYLKTAFYRIVPVRAQPSLRAKLARVYHLGWRHRCPLCRAWLRAFEPHGFDFPVLRRYHVVGGGWRPEARCPVCKSRDRDRLLYLYLRCRTDLFSRPQKVLHVAPEAALTTVLARRRTLDYLTADLMMPGVMEEMDVTRIRHPDGTFDAIICCHVLEHVPEDRQAMREFHRTLKPGGWAILQVPLSTVLERTLEDPSVQAPEDRERIFGQADHVRIYARDYLDRLAEAGFSVEVFRWSDAPMQFGGPTNRFGLNPEEAVFVGHKSGCCP